jgi:general secretion pathway protein E
MPMFDEFDPKDPDFAVKVIDWLLPLAIERGASDVHVHPRQHGWEILIRIDGVLTSLDKIPGGGRSDPVARMMVLAGLPTYRSTQPMEGRLCWKSPREAKCELEETSMRLGIFPTVHGPRAVIRLLRHDAKFDTVSSLGMPTDVARSLRQLCGATDGVILLSGPAGSGKTTTMYAMLREIASAMPRRSVVTIEDPVESVIESISQSELDPAGGMTLSSALRSAVRQDSEVLLVSEVRDPETAEAALQSSLTGHLIFSSLHATDVAATLRRLQQFGVPPFVIRSGLRAVVAQRLVRRLCPKCQPSASQVGSHGHGDATCDACFGTGYCGRMAIAQCVHFDGHDVVGDVLVNALESGRSADQMRQLAREAGAKDLWTCGQEMAELGHTDMAEIYRVLGSAPGQTTSA